MASYSLYPPIVDSYIPAFLVDDNKIVIQFRLSNLNSSTYFETVQAVVSNAKTGVSIVKLSNSSGHYRKTGTIINLSYRKITTEDNLYEVEILKDDIEDSSFGDKSVGLVYKIQLRLSTITYAGEGTIGQADWLNSNPGSFSEWSTALYTTSIKSVDYSHFNIHDMANGYNSNFLTLSGTFESNPKTEIVEECDFILYDSNDNEIERSETIVLRNTQSFEYSFETELVNRENYKLRSHFITKNLYEKVEDFNFYVSYEETSLLNYALKTLEDGITETDLIKEEENGYIALKIKPINNNYPEQEEIADQEYVIDIKRSDSECNFKRWITIKQIKGIISTIEKLPIIIDNTIESRVFYQYKMQITKIGEDYKISPSFGDTQKISRDFDYSFLLGEKRQLKLNFNNSLGNYNYQITESKKDTLGGTFPIITRNSASYYRSFTINGLVSFQSDEQEMFYSQDEIYGSEETKQLYKNKYYSQQNSDKINVDAYDYYYEKKFREKVIQFLYDGKIKLFKSPTEGNILVRLMNVSFNPNQSLNRMIYTFSCTAYEIGEVNMENLINNNITTFIYDKNSIIPEPIPTPEPDPDYRKGYYPSETSNLNVEVIDSVKKETHDMEITIINQNDVEYHDIDAYWEVQNG